MGWIDRIRRGDRAWWLACGLGLVFLAAHLPFLASTLEDVDSINFALGIRDFDPATHRPHPPGYPIFIALAKLARLALSEPHALAVWAAVFGALAVFPLLRLFQALDGLDPQPADRPADTGWWTPPVLATIVVMTAPLYWMSGVRPMSDSVGLAVAVTAQALLAAAFVRQSQDVPDARGNFDPAMAARSGRLILLGAFVAALAIGVRSQALWLTVPLLIVVLVSRVGRGAAGALIGASVWFAAGALLWFVPLVVSSGGPTAYLAALTSQAGEDWSGVELLVTQPSMRRLAFGMMDTFVTHWAGLGWAVAAAAVVGAGVVLARRRRALWFLVAAFGPYAVFHLLFQELVTTRYALPLLVPVVYLAVRGLWLLGRVPATAIAVGGAIVALVQVVPVTAQYSRNGSPASLAIADLRTEVNRVGPAWLGRHYSFARALQADLDDSRVSVISAPPRYAWREVGHFITSDARRPLWVLDTPRHAKLSLIDPSALVVRKSYRWPFPAPVFLGGVRPSDVDWIEIREPGWVAMEGWHLTPDTAGMAVADGSGLGRGPIVAQVRTRSGAAAVMIGGRHLGRPTDASLVFTLRVGDREIETWTVPPEPAFFLRVVSLPSGTLAGAAPWTPLTIEARNALTGQPSGLGAVEQFDLRDVTELMIGYDTGWHEQELNPATGVSWRWAGEHADLRIVPADRDAVIRMRGESPLRSFSNPSKVIIRAGSHVLKDLVVSEDFDWAVTVPAAMLSESGGIVRVTTDQTFRPSERGLNADQRSLGLRIYAVTIKPAS
jgi:hypothetical protein